tara:strand:+ start:37690 stop:38019 length:330 start_codon:yes stop_codon:yes gene_type:complete
VLSSATDPYLQIEKDTRITRSDLIVRDFDLPEGIKSKAILPDDLKGKAPPDLLITFSISTINDTIAYIFEPGATPPSVRLGGWSSGFHTGISLMPLLPYISDTGRHLLK